MKRSILSSCVLLLTALAGPGFIGRVSAQGVRTEIHPMHTVTLTEPQFLTGATGGQPAVLGGELRLPRGNERIPVVVLVHGSGGVGSGMMRWAEELNAAGMGTFVLDHFSGRGIRQTATDQSQLAHVAMIADAYRALELLARHPRVDPTRIAVMGFSKGGFAAYVAFYPICIRTYIEDEQVSDRPIRIFHGVADDWLPVEACREYVTRLRRAGKDAALTEYPGARHGFDNPAPPPLVSLPDVQAGPTCRLEERPGGQMVFRDTGQPFGLDHPCVRRGATIGYDAAAYQASLKAVKELLASTFGQKGPR